MAFIIKPIVTEKMTRITEKRPNRYGFIVKPEANKIQIKQEVEARYNVTVEDVNTMRYAGKRSSRYTKAGLIRGQKNAFKKAIVTLARSRILLHPCQRSLSFTVSVLPVVETTLVR